MRGDVARAVTRSATTRAVAVGRERGGDDARGRRAGRARDRRAVSRARGAKTTSRAWEGAERAPACAARTAAQAFVRRWEAMGATPSATLADMASLRPLEGADARLCVENAVYESDVFRKMHCELAWGDGGFEVLHVVMYPWASRAAPVFAADVVGFGGRLSLCIADCAPVTADLSLPSSYVERCGPMLEEALRGGVERRELPEWGRAILGPLCLCVGPKMDDRAAADVDAFFDYAFKLHDAHCELASSPALELDARDRRALDAQVRFCARQLENVKTRRALERAFGPTVADAYMREILFDVTPLTPTRAS